MSQTWFQSTNARVAGAFAVAAALQIVGTLLIPGYSAPFAIRALLV
ncbi:MAG: ABC transporter permease, partial [Mesorhizobium sp.]